MQLPSHMQVMAELDTARLEQLLVDLINIYSPPGEEEHILQFLEGTFDRVGLPFTRQAVSARRYNLLLSLGAPKPPTFYLLGHVDTIVGHHWDDYRARWEGESAIAGLGAADMKGGVAAMIEAFLALHRAGYPDDAPPIGLALLVDEEEGGAGIETFVREHQPQYAIVGEPTELQLCHQHYGFCELLLRTQGKRVHSALPERGHNAILDMMSLIQTLQHSVETMQATEGGHTNFVNVREISGLNADFVVPSSCEAYLDLHLHPTQPSAAVRQRVEAEITDFSQQVPQAQIQHTWTMNFDGFRLEEDEGLVRLGLEASSLVGLSPTLSTFRSHSDANLLTRNGTRCLMSGPGALFHAHTTDEIVDTQALAQAARFYATSLLLYAQQDR